MSTTSTETKKVSKGGEFIIKDISFADVFTKEELNEEQKMIMQTAADFINNRVMPNVVKIDKHEPGLVLQLFQESADLGLLGAGVPGRIRWHGS